MGSKYYSSRYFADIPPRPLHGRIQGASVRSERIVNRRGRATPPSVWLPRNRRITAGPFAGSLYDPRVTPYVQGIVDAIFFPSVRYVSIYKSPQSGLSTMLDSIMAWTAEFRPGPWLVVYPDQLTARLNAKRRIRPMFEQSPGLRRLLTGDPDDLTSLELHLITQTIRMGWSGSVTSLGNFSAKYVGLDEVDKYDIGRKEAGPIALAEKRTTAFPEDARIIKISTPTVEDGPIWHAVNKESSVVYAWQVACPDCGERQVMQFAQIHWDGGGDADPAAIEDGELAYYVCPHCGSAWDDAARNAACEQGRWVEAYQPEGELYYDAGPDAIPLEDSLRNRHPARIGFHLPAWNSRMVSLSKCAAAFIRGQHSIDRLKDFQNAFAALPWRQVVHAVSGSHIMGAVTDLAPRTVPEHAICLTCGIDTQKYGFWYVVRAWAADYTSWLVDFGQLALWGDVETLLFDTWYPVQDSPDSSMAIWRAAIDTGGGRSRYAVDEPQDVQGASSVFSSTAEETYFWLRDNQRGRGCRVWGIKGASTRIEPMVKLSQPIDRTPSGKPLKGGLRIALLDTYTLKDMVHYRLSKAREQEARAAYLHAGSETYWREYCSHLTAEEKRRNSRGFEEWVQIRKDNHLLDCECYCHAVAAPEFFGGLMSLRGHRARYRDESGNMEADQAVVRPDVIQDALKQRRRRPDMGRRLW